MDVLQRVEESECVWPGRKHLVACFSVCRSWRKVCKDFVETPEKSGTITFPISLKQPGPRIESIQCYVKRNKSSSTYHLYLGGPARKIGKFLLAARMMRYPTRAEYIMSLDPDDISVSNNSYMGKLSSNYFRTRFDIYDSQLPYHGSLAPTSRASQQFYRLPSIVRITYEVDSLSKRHPRTARGMFSDCITAGWLSKRDTRHMRCIMRSIPASALEPDGSCYPEPLRFEDACSGISLSPSSADHLSGDAKSAGSSGFSVSTRFTEASSIGGVVEEPLVLKNKPPRWHQELKHWCLNFHGRATFASLRNFQLIAASSEPEDSTDGGHTSLAGPIYRSPIILLFGKLAEDVFAMDYRYPLSAFQAFGICLSSFNSNLAREDEEKPAGISCSCM